MASAGCGLDPTTNADQYAVMLAGARGTSEVVAAVREYLAAWPKACVMSVQRVDGGWAPFDANQQPTPLYRSADVRKICDAVQGQRAALLGAGVAPAPEFLELVEFLALACAKLKELEPEPAPQQPGRGAHQPVVRAER